MLWVGSGNCGPSKESFFRMSDSSNDLLICWYGSVDSETAFLSVAIKDG